MIFVITWLFFGGYRKFIPTEAVEKVRDLKSSKSSEDEGDAPGTTYTSRTNDTSERQYIEEGQTRTG